MPRPPPFAAPVAIGGLGGSGTRVFAAMLRHGGYHIGETLNAPLDNLWFTVLFKRAAWARTRPDPADIATSVRLFTRAMTTGLRGDLDPAERALIAALRDDLHPNGPWRCGAQPPHADALLDSGPQPGGAGRPWGWKEPNTHVFLPHLDRLIPGLRYVHIVRDGYDMAFSTNTWQARHWAHLYPVPRDPDLALPLRQLQYWIAANRAALDYGRRHMPGRFLALQYEDFCARPDQHWDILRRFVGAAPDLALPTDLVQPTTIGRSQDHDLSLFAQNLHDEVQALQSDVAKFQIAG